MYFLDGSYKSDLNPSSSSKGLVATSFAQLINRIATASASASRNQVRYISPSEFQSSVIFKKYFFYNLLRF